MAGFCGNCGTPVSEGSAFCGACGARVASAPAAAPDPAMNPAVDPAPAPAASTPATPPVPRVVAAAPAPAAAAPVSAPAQKSGGCGKILLTVGIIFVLLMLAGLAGFGYLAYRTKKKVDEIKQAYKEGDADKMAGALTGKEVISKPVDNMPDYPAYSGAVPSVLPGGSSTPPAGAEGEVSIGSVVPMKRGLRITTAIQQSVGDYESMKTITSVSGEAVKMDYTADVPKAKNPFDNKPQGNSADEDKTQKVRTRRRILRTDLDAAHEYAESFNSNGPETIPNTTALGVSASVLNDLKSKGEAQFSYAAIGLKGALGNLIGGLNSMTGGMQNAPGGAGGTQSKDADDAMKELAALGKETCTLKRVDNVTHAFPVLVNGQRTTLPAIRATCKSDDDVNAEFYFLDDPGNPLSLTWKLGSSDRLQVIKIDYVPDTPAAPAQDLEQKLAKNEKVQIYGIYFDFASAKIKPESKPTLDEIAAVMKAHPDWKLRVDGHTDNVGGDAFNLELSRRRAASVKATLVEDYAIAPERLDTEGHGAAVPVETNSTMEGRARNRRVELSRE